MEQALLSRERNFDFYDNAITLVKYIAAFQVLIKHIIMHFKLGGGVPRFFDIFSGVPVFFCLSGFLIAHSLSKDNGLNNSLSGFFKRRLLRLMPELIMIVLLDSIILLMFQPTLITKPGFYLFNVTQLTLLQGWTPDILRFYGTGVPNGSLWTMAVTFEFYFIVYYMYPKIKNKSHLFHLCVIVLSIMVSNKIHLLKPYIHVNAYSVLRTSLVTYFYIFYIGIYLYICRERIIPMLEESFWLILTIVIMYVLLWKELPSNYMDSLRVTMICILAISMAYRFKNIKIKKDYSFGLYLWHMVFINLFIELNIMNSWGGMMVVIVLSFGCSVISYKWTQYVNKKFNKKSAH